ncbi:hypothetical protein [Nonomuraea sp. CA-141351]|uniref:hypothetical protein n=1 Tax=Nonomuraea sp. CA-141351 TaxID=3239996 RepID=UPI003D928FB7
MATSQTPAPQHQESRLGAPLVAAAAVITAAGALYPFSGVVALVVAVVGLVAIVATVRTRPARTERVLGPYVLVIVLTLVADTARFSIDYPARLGSAVGWATAPLDVRTWFVGLVVAPVTIMLFGGYLLGRRLPGAHIAAWWTALAGALDGLAFLAVAPTTDWSQPAVSVAAAAATLGQLTAATVLVQRLLQPSATTSAKVTSLPMDARRRNLWTLLFLVLVAVYAVSLQQQAGLLPVGVIVGSMVGGMVGWRRTTSRAPADPAFHVPLFLLLLALFYLHVGEEALTDFNRAIAEISGTPWADTSFTTLIGLLGPAVWVFAAWSLWRRQAFGNFVLWFLIVGMILGEPTHLVVFPVMRMVQEGVSYGYFSGMYTALFPMIPAILALRAILRTHRTRTATRAKETPR